MKKTTIVLIAGFSFCTLGGALCAAGYANGGMHDIKASGLLPDFISEKPDRGTHTASEENLSGDIPDSMPPEYSPSQSDDPFNISDGGNSVSIFKNGKSVNISGNGKSVSISKSQGGKTVSMSNHNKSVSISNDGERSGIFSNHKKSAQQPAGKSNNKNSNKHTFRLTKKKLNAFTAMQADLKHVDFKIVPSKNSNSYIQYTITSKTDGNPFSYKVNDGILTLTEKKGMPNFYCRYISGNKKKTIVKDKNLVTLYITNSQMENAIFTLGEGDLSIKGLHTQSIKISGKDGDVLLNGSSAQQGSLSIKDGDFVLKNTSLSKCKLSADYGNYSCHDITLKNSTLHSEDGDLSFQNSTLRDSSIVTDYGDISLSGTTVSGKTLTSHDGDFILKQSQISNCILDTDYGDYEISGSNIRGGSLYTDDGNYNLKNTNLVGKIKLTTDYGDIDAKSLSVQNQVEIEGNETDLSISLTPSCKKNASIYAKTGYGSIKKNDPYSGKVAKKGDSRTYTRTADKNMMLSITVNDGDLSLQ